MDTLLTFVISILEWVALLTFPIVLLGYYYRKFFRSIVIISIFMSLFSLGLHTFSHLPVAFIISLQIATLIIFIKWILKITVLESLTITSLGYGFYAFFQMIIIEFIVQLSTFQYFQFYDIANLKYITQIFTLLLVYIFCYFIQKFQFQLNELRLQLKIPLLKNNYKILLITISLQTYIFLYLNFYYMLLDDFENKHVVLLVIMVVIFINLLGYLILHTKIQQIRIIESKKFLFDQEQQIANLLEKVQADYENHFKAIVKLYERNSSHLINDYINNHQLTKKQKGKSLNTSSFSHLANKDEVLYAFLVNKQKLAKLLGVHIDVSKESNITKLLTLQHIRYLHMFFDDLIMLLYKTATKEEKVIHFKITANMEHFTIHISSPFEFNEKVISNSKIFDALLQLKNQNATIKTCDFAPLKITIECPFL